MAYFNGGLHGWNGPNGYVPPERTTAHYCNDCAETEIPLLKVGDPVIAEQRWQVGDTVRPGRRHWGTGFRWAPYYGGPCSACGKAC